jgi:lipopolysaccharide biosynthesis regulator YciM
MSTTTAFIIIAILVILWAPILYFIIHRRGQRDSDRPDQGDYIEGLKALLRDQHEQAFVKLKDTVSVDTNNVDAYIRLGDIFRERKQPEQALRVHRDLTFRKNLAQAEKMAILKALYYDFLEMEDESSAVKAIREILDQSPNDRFALETILRYVEKSGDWKEAALIRKKLDKLDGHASGRILALYKVFEGDDLNEKGDRHRARLFYKEAIHLDKNCLAAYVAIGDSYYNEGRLEDAINYWNKVIAQKPEDGQLVFERLKKGFFEIGRYGDYADALSNLLQVYPEHKTARLELAYFQEKKGNQDLARENYITAQDNNPDSMLVKLGLYRLNRDTGRKDAADNIFKQIMKLTVKKEVGSYCCQKCGLESQNMVWLCPRCKAVDSFKHIEL